mgnify:CR=1 FL=1
MQKKSRFLTGLLSAVMALTLFALPATAEEGVANQLTNTDVWGTSTASITIHKYEYNRPNNQTGKAASGLQLPDTDIPEEAKPLEGAKFKIYKVQDRDALAEYYSGKDLTEEQYNQFTVASHYYKVDDNGVYTVKDGNGTPVTNGVEQTTDAQGETTFAINTKDLGLYLVIETYAPDKVKTKQPPFLVSVPMKDPGDQTSWLYNIHVYPKNATQYGSVVVKKEGITGEEDGILLDDVTFKLYKKGDSNNWVEVTKPEDGSATKFDLTTVKGLITIAGLSKGDYKLVEQKFEGDEGNKGYIISEEPITFTIDPDGKVSTTNVDQDPTNANTIIVKNYRPDLDKTVYNESVTDKGGYVEGANYSVGDMVPYRITIKVPQDIKKLKTFTVTDTPQNLRDDVNNITITKDGTAIDTSAYKQPVTNEDGGFTIEFVPSKMSGYAGKTLVIAYNAELLDTADRTTGGNTNNAKLTYTNKINEDGEGYTGSEYENTIEDETVVYTFAIRIKKTDENKTKGLPGAKFDLYKDVTDKYKDSGEAVPNDVITSTAASSKGLDGKHYWKKVDGELVSSDNGLVTTSDKKGLANGTYYLVETQAPKGYNLLAKPVEVKLNIAYKYSWGESNTYDEKGNLKKHVTSQKAEKFDPAEKNGAGAQVVGNQKSDANENEDIGVGLITVINRKGFNLPVTGGFGTLLFSGIGALLVVGGVGVLMGTKKKKDNA